MLFNLPRTAALAVLLSTLVSCMDTVQFANLLKTKLSPGAKVYFPSDANYTSEVTLRSSSFEQPTYLATVQPAITSDVQTIVKLASQYRVPFLATGGGHAGTITEKALHGLQIDLKLFKNVTYNAKSSTITVGGGAVMKDTYATIEAAGKELQVTSSSCVGLVGAAIGGGIGRLQGLHGLITDSFVSVDIVTASGALLTASAKQNPDLFWAVRGAGANFGIITSATFQVYDASNGGQYLNADFAFYNNYSIQYFEALATFDKTLPAGLSLTSSVRWNATAKQAYLYLNAVYAGPEAEGVAYLAPFYALNPFLTDKLMVKYGDINNKAFFGLGDSADCDGPVANQQPFSDWGLGLKQVVPEHLEAWFTNVNNFYLANPALRAISTTLQRFPTNAVLEQPENTTAYPESHREIILHVLFINTYNISNATLNNQVNTFMRDSRAFLQQESGFPELTIYDNYAHGDEGPIVWYSAKSLARLIPLKKLLDPARLFSWTNPIPC